MESKIKTQKMWRTIMKLKKYYAMGAISVLFLLGWVNPAIADGGIVNFNTATAEEIMSIEYVHIPQSLAEAIVEYREEHGPFLSTDELSRVPGMTHNLMEEINPVMKDGDVVFDPDAEPTLAPSKC